MMTRKFEFPELGDSLSVRIENHTRIRFGVIDSFLADKFGSTWLTRSRLIRDDLCCISRKDLWEFALQSNFLLRLFKSGQTEFFLEPDVMTVDAIRFQAECNSFCFLSNSQMISDDLETAWHPKFHGRKVFPNCTDFERGRERVNKSLGIIKPYPQFINLVRNECGAVCFLGSEPAMEEGQCISLTSRMVPGLIYVSDAPPILLAESLVHEAAHLRFRAVEEVSDLYVAGSDVRVVTPLRTDPRPMSGLMHQLVVLRHLVALYDLLRTSEEVSIARQRPQVEKRFALHLQDLEVGKRMAKSAKRALTQKGCAMLDCLLDDTESTLV